MSARNAIGIICIKFMLAKHWAQGYHFGKGASRNQMNPLKSFQGLTVTLSVSVPAREHWQEQPPASTKVNIKLSLGCSSPESINLLHL
jgi:hypothetical protein